MSFILLVSSLRVEAITKNIYFNRLIFHPDSVLFETLEVTEGGGGGDAVHIWQQAAFLIEADIDVTKNENVPTEIYLRNGRIVIQVRR